MDKIQKSLVLDSFCKSLDSIGCSSIGIAVSGGSDSMALFYLSLVWSQRTGNVIEVVSVDHGLREGSSREIEFVKDRVSKNLITHFSLKPEVDINKLQGNTQDNARKVRYKLLADWAVKKNIKCILLGHTLDDQEENLILRFFRGSGVDGLSSIERKKFFGNVTWFRPLIEYRKFFLQSFLKEIGKDWVEDPSNNDDKFERVKIRKLIPKLKENGLIKKNFVQTAHHMRRASKVLASVAIEETKSMILISKFGEIKIDILKYLKAHEDTRLRILSGLISWYSGRFYKPRFAQLDKLQRLIAEKNCIKGASLSGTIIKRSKGFISITRELSAIKDIDNIRGKKVLWDNRWSVTFDKTCYNKLKIVPLGSLDYDKKEIFDLELSRKGILDTLPAIVNNNKLVFTPFSKLSDDIKVNLLQGDKHLYKNF